MRAPRGWPGLGVWLVLVVSLLVPGAAHALPGPLGALTQLAGVGACVSNDGNGGVADAPVDPECAPGQGLDEAVAIVVSPDGKHVYVASFDGDAVAAFVRDPAAGTVTQLVGAAGCISDDTDGGVADTPSDPECTPGQGLGGASGIAVSPDGKYVYVAVFCR